MDGGRNGNMGMEGEREIDDAAGEVHEMGFGSRGKNTRYIVREELQREKLKSRAGKRVWGFEKRLAEGRAMFWRRGVGRR